MIVYFQSGKFDLQMTCNGILSGLVAITAGCDRLLPWSAVAAGAIAAPIMLLAAHIEEVRRIDDPVGAFPVPRRI